MSDLTDRLRYKLSYSWDERIETADEIDRLTADLDAEKLFSKQAMQTAQEIAAERDALREQLTLAESVRAAQVAGLTEGLEALQRDAVRYRWLRDGDLPADAPWPVMREDGGNGSSIWAEELDAAIDAFIDEMSAADRAALKGEA